MPRTPATPASEPVEPVEPAEPVATEPLAADPAPSILDRVRGNQMGPLAAALIVGSIVGIVLSILVPSPINVWALMLLGALVAAAVGFSVRYLSEGRSWGAQIPAFIGTMLGVHLMAVTGAVAGTNVGRIGDLLKIDGPGFEDGLLVALAAPALSAGSVVAALVAAIIAGWGPREAK